MEQLEFEQTEHESCAVQTENELDEGKQELSNTRFKDVRSLQKAYSSLESEFTKRSQRLRELEGERENLMKQLEARQAETKQSPLIDSQASQEETSAQSEDFFKQFPNALEYAKELAEISAARGGITAQNLARTYIEKLENRLQTESEKLSDEDFLLSHIGSSPIKDKIIKNYLSDIKNSQSSPKLIDGGGEIVLAPPIKPRSIEEAGRLAKDILIRK